MHRLSSPGISLKVLAYILQKAQDKEPPSNEMASKANSSITIADLYLAYRKAKIEAFYEKGHFSAIAFAKYEENLDSNLEALLTTLIKKNPTWMRDPQVVGGHTYMPKSIGKPKVDENIFCCSLDPLDEWRRLFKVGGRQRFEASFRLLITPSVRFHIISALWINKVGYKYDACIDRSVSYAYRLRTKDIVLRDGTSRTLPNTDSLGIFEPYFSGYRTWRERGLSSMRQGLQKGRNIAAVTMDLEKFFHNINPSFLLRKQFLEKHNILLSPFERRFTSQFLLALKSWYETTPDYVIQPKSGLPIGLSASKIISNVLLAEFDTSISSKLKPVFYGRYVDDVFLVLESRKPVNSGNQVLEQIAEKLSPLVVFNGKPRFPSLDFKPSYARDSKLRFKGEKQKIFLLNGASGLDLVRHIAERIRRNSSEHRLLPLLPETEAEMANEALLTTPNSNLEADSLRKAESVSLKRLGFAMLLADAETYARTLIPSEWREVRLRLYGLVERHLLTPSGFFDYSAYIHRVFQLMVVTGDYVDATNHLLLFRRLILTIRNTTSAGTTQSKQFRSCITYYSIGLRQALIQGLTKQQFAINASLRTLLRTLARLSGRSQISVAELTKLRSEILKADLGWRPYKEFWMQANHDEEIPMIRHRQSVLKLLRLRGIKDFITHSSSEVRKPYWPALAFPTRPLKLAEISFIAPRSLEKLSILKRIVLALRGAHLSDTIKNILNHSEGNASPKAFLQVPLGRRPNIVFAVTSVETTLKQWKAALLRRPLLSKTRFRVLSMLLNDILRSKQKPDYIVLPECSLPLKWSIHFASKLAENKVSLVAGLEYRRQNKTTVVNEALISLTTSWPGYPTFILHRQPKLLPAYEEIKLIRAERRGLHFSKPSCRSPLPIYVHGNFRFGVLICSDLTTIANRYHFQGEVDALIVLEWNQDITTFNSLVESCAHDVHAYIIQVNNRTYGDSRIRAPLKFDYQRDVVRVKGGLTDYFVTAAIDFHALRAFQKRAKLPEHPFKPYPIGFQMSERRRKLPS